MGVDLILDEWIATTRRLSSNDVATAWSEMEAAWKRATATDDHVGRLRYQRVLLYRPGITPSVFNNILSNIMQPENLEYASPAVMETMFEGAMTRHQTNFATRIANAIVTDYPETDIALDARMLLARTAIAESRTANPADADKLLDAAIEHLDVVRGIFATSSEAAEALLLLGTIYRDRNRLNEAQECLEAVLGVRNWRNFWPEALYGLGLCMETRRDWERATPYYERIYLMYSGSRHWTAKAYLRRAESLNRLYKDQQALETLVEMLAQDDLRQYPEFVTATELHRKLEGRK
jgi:tetratricopeptide (TPR) repeat protein